MKISKSSKQLARKLHKAEHLIIEGKCDKTHNLNEYYYFMACQLVENLTNEIKEISKQNKYLWQTLEEVIEELKSQSQDLANKTK
jgi:hypothetical protein